MLRIVTVALSLLAVPATALAFSCPSIMSEIDAALPSADLSEADMARVQELRTLGEQEHQAGNHPASESALEEAKEILGI